MWNLGEVTYLLGDHSFLVCKVRIIIITNMVLELNKLTYIKKYSIGCRKYNVSDSGKETESTDCRER
jgi:hypothetical protein